MKKFIFMLIASILIIQTGAFSQSENVGIGTTNPDNSAILDLDVSTTSSKMGLLIPRMTTAEKNGIANPAKGLIVYDTSDDFFYYNQGTSASPNWVPLLFGIVDLTSDVTGILPVSNGGTGTSAITGMVKGNGTSPFTGITAGAGQVTYWSDANTIAGDANFIWNSTSQTLDITGSLEASNSVSSPIYQYQPLGTQPSTPSEGMTYYDSGLDELQIYINGAWESIGSGGGATYWTQSGSDLFTNQSTWNVYWQDGSVANTQSTAWGGATASGYRTTAWGTGSTASSNLATAWGDNTISSGNTTTAWGKNNTANQNLATTWGDGNTASGNAATAWGNGNIATQNLATVWGQNNTSSNSLTTVWGSGNTANANLATAWGESTTASGNKSTAFGTSTTASADHTTAWGNQTAASAQYSTAFGSGTIASGQYGTAFGLNTTASGQYSTAYGHNTTASGQFSTVWGDSTIANSQRATAWGQSTTASNNLATSWGQSTTANNELSTAWGLSTNANGRLSTALGSNTTAYSGMEFVIGQYNASYTPNNASDWNENDKLFVAGVGTGSSDQKDGFVIYKDGATDIFGNTSIKSNDNATANELRFYEDPSSGTNYTSFEAKAQDNDISYTLPNTIPQTGSSLLKTDLNGDLSWTSFASVGGSFVDVTVTGSDYTATNDDFLIVLSTSGRTITLPSASSSAGKVYYIVLGPGGNNFEGTILTQTGDDIAAKAAVNSIKLNYGNGNSDFSGALVASDGVSRWYIIASRRVNN